MTLKQVEPVECGEMLAFNSAMHDDRIVIREGRDAMVLTEPEARALLEFLRKVCE